jgi:acyl-coenzyme A thioesterase PaaI-like protein
MTKQELQTFFVTAFPNFSSSYCIERVISTEVIMRLKVQHDHLRPGGTVSGPTSSHSQAMMYATILSKVGPKALAVTTNCSIDFLRKPAAGKDLLARCHIHKLGKVLVVEDVLRYSATTATDDSVTACYQMGGGSRSLYMWINQKKSKKNQNLYALN